MEKMLLAERTCNRSYRVGVIADFNAQNFASLLRKTWAPVGVECLEAPLGQTMQLLLDHKAQFWGELYDAVVVWTLPELCFPEFQRAIACEGFSLKELLAQVDVFAASVRQAHCNARSIIVPSLAMPWAGRGWGAMDCVSNLGPTNLLMQVNLRLAEQFASDQRVLFLDSQRWISTAGTAAYNPKLWYMAKTPFHTSVFREAAGDVLAALDGVHGRSKKVIVLDLDNTLWGGVVGDEGWQKLRLGGHDHVGEAFVDFQRGLKRLMRRGILLAIVSKNQEATALEAIRKHPEMVLKVEDFAGWKINWEDKAQNIKEVMAALNLGLNSAVFLDDSAFERGQVRDELPDIFVPELPCDPVNLPVFLASLRCFGSRVARAS
jgi:HAD superfamily phosphatase (TIGR01681 family)